MIYFIFFASMYASLSMVVSCMCMVYVCIFLSPPFSVRITNLQHQTWIFSPGRQGIVTSNSGCHASPTRTTSTEPPLTPELSKHMHTEVISCIYMCMYITAIKEEKETVNLKQRNEQRVRGTVLVERREGEIMQSLSKNIFKIFPLMVFAPEYISV